MQFIEAIPYEEINKWKTENVDKQELEHINLTDSLSDYLRANFIDGSMGLRTTIDGRDLSTNGIHTNGEWIWRSSLEYYIFECRFPIPRGFVDSIRNDNVEAPSLSDECIPTKEEYLSFFKKPDSTFYILT